MNPVTKRNVGILCIIMGVAVAVHMNVTGVPVAVDTIAANSNAPRYVNPVELGISSLLILSGAWLVAKYYRTLLIENLKAGHRTDPGKPDKSAKRGKKHKR